MFSKEGGIKTNEEILLCQNFLNISLYAHDEIRSEYIYARLGEETYKINKSIAEFIQSFNQISILNIKSYFNHEIPKINTITNRMDLEYFFKAVCENESKRADGFLHMMIQNDMAGQSRKIENNDAIVLADEKFQFKLM